MRTISGRTIRAAASAALAVAAAACVPAARDGANEGFLGSLDPTPRQVVDIAGRRLPATSDRQVDATGYALGGVPLQRAAFSTTKTSLFQTFDGRSDVALLTASRAESFGSSRDSFRPDAAPVDAMLLGAHAGWDAAAWGPRPSGLKPSERQRPNGGLRQIATWTATMPKESFKPGPDKKLKEAACAAARDYADRTGFLQAMNAVPAAEPGRGAIFRLSSRAQVCVVGGTAEGASAMAERALEEMPLVARGLRGTTH